jgi:hypothetical protein
MSKREQPTGPEKLPQGIKPLETHPTLAKIPVRVWLIEPHTKTMMVRDTEGYVHGECEPGGQARGPWVLSDWWYFGKCCCECDPLDFGTWISEVCVMKRNEHGGEECVDSLKFDRYENDRWADLTCEAYPVPLMAAVRGEHAGLFQPVAFYDDNWHEIAVGLLGESYTKVLMRAFRSTAG